MLGALGIYRFVLLASVAAATVTTTFAGAIQPAATPAASTVKPCPPAATPAPSTVKPFPPASGSLVEVSVCKDATYALPTSRGAICSGAGASPAGMACPVKGDQAIKDCHPYLPSWNGKECVAKEDAECRIVTGTTWGCVFPSAGADADAVPSGVDALSFIGQADSLPNHDDPVSSSDDADAVPTNEDALPVKGDALPTKGDAVPTNEDPVSPDGDTVPNDCDAMPTKGDTVLNDGDSVPTKGDPVSSNR
ncbi:hypothetical protein Gpo141_00009836 [Globisporangium polare]